MTFEESLEKLNQIKSELDDENITLDRSVELYKESVTYTKNCLDMLKSTEGKILVVKQELDKLTLQTLSEKEE